jgi:RNA polymerase sigma factor (sigma-70 family)
VPGLPGLRLRTLADVFAYAAAHGVELRIDATETQVRRPRANRPGRRAFVSGKRKQNTTKTATVSDGRGRTLWAGAVRPGRMHDQTAVKTDGIWDLFQQYPTVTAQVDTGYRGLAKALPIGCAPHRSHRPKTRPPSRWSPTRRQASTSRPGGSVSSTPSPSTSSGGPCNAISDAARPTPRPTWPSPAWSPTGQPAVAEQPPADRSGRRASTPIAHQVVTRFHASRARSSTSCAHRLDPAVGAVQGPEVEKAYAHLENRLYRTPTDAEVAQQLGISTDELHHIFNQISFVSVVALDELLTVGSERGDRLSLVDTLEDKTAEDPEAAFESEEMKSILAGAINRLAEREKIVITLYYYEGLTLAEIGQVLGVTESRVCQMHTKAVLQLRGKMQDVR